MPVDKKNKRITQLKQELRDLTKFMNVPCFKYDDVKWLDKNLERMNQNHPSCKSAREILNQLIKLGAE